MGDRRPRPARRQAVGLPRPGARRLQRRCANSGVTVDVVSPGADLAPLPAASSCPVCTWCATTTPPASRDWVAGGGHARRHLLQRHRRRGRPGARSAATPARSASCSACASEEFAAAAAGRDGAARRTARPQRLWTERLRADHRRGRSYRFVDGPVAGRSRRHPQRAAGAGEAWYVATALDPAALRDRARAALGAAGVSRRREDGADLELVRRTGRRRRRTCSSSTTAPTTTIVAAIGPGAGDRRCRSTGVSDGAGRRGARRPGGGAHDRALSIVDRPGKAVRAEQRIVALSPCCVTAVRRSSSRSST